MKKPLATSETRTALETDVCCSSSFPSGSSCKKNDYALQHKVTTTSSQSSLSSSSGFSQFLRNIKGLYAAALGIEILCIAAAEIGENTSLYLFGFNLVGIPIAYAMGYALQDLQPLLQYLADTIIRAQIMTRLIAAVLQS